MEIFRITGDNSEQVLKDAAKVLAKGGIVLYPTDTLYGLAVDALNPLALGTLRALKGREKKKPISIIVPEVAHIEQHAHLHDEARTLAERHLPGALTLVLPGKAHLPEELLLNGQIGVRVPNDPIALGLVRALGRPITATSANRSGLRTPTTPDAVLGQFGKDIERIDVVLDAGPREGSLASTVVTFIDGVPYIIREGAISRSDLFS
jgi:L-threonylcarbamoyladenylate synthase